MATPLSSGLLPRSQEPEEEGPHSRAALRRAVSTPELASLPDEEAAKYKAEPGRACGSGFRGFRGLLGASGGCRRFWRCWRWGFFRGVCVEAPCLQADMEEFNHRLRQRQEIFIGPCSDQPPTFCLPGGPTRVPNVPRQQLPVQDTLGFFRKALPQEACPNFFR